MSLNHTDEVLDLINGGHILIMAQICVCVGYSWPLHDYFLRMWEKYVVLKGFDMIEKEQMKEDPEESFLWLC